MPWPSEDDEFDDDDDEEDICEECGADLAAGDDHEADCSLIDDDEFWEDFGDDEEPAA